MQLADCSLLLAQASPPARCPPIESESCITGLHRLSQRRRLPPVDYYIIPRASLHPLASDKKKRKKKGNMPSPTARPPGRQHPLRQHPIHISPSTNGSSDTHPATRPDQNHHISPAFPFSLRLPFQSNPTSASLAPSIAEGKPIPVDDTTAEHRTSALRELNHNYPSRHRYAKSTGAQNTTYSEPVIVRSYYSPVPHSRSGTIARHGGVVIRAPAAVLGSVAGSTASRRRSAPFTGKGAPAGNGVLNIMARARGREKGPVQSQPEEAKLPPMEAFTFKNFIATLDEQGNGGGR